MVAALCLGSHWLRNCLHIHQFVYVHHRQLPSVCRIRTHLRYSSTLRRCRCDVSREVPIALPLQASTDTYQGCRRHTDVQQLGHALGADHFGLYQRSHHSGPVCLVLLGRSDSYKEQIRGSLMTIVFVGVPGSHLGVSRVRCPAQAQSERPARKS
jgi:hypothetical protein